MEEKNNTTVDIPENDGEFMLEPVPMSARRSTRSQFMVFRLSVTRTIFSVRGYRVSEVYRRISAKSNAVRVCVTTVSLLPARGSEIMKTSATPLRTYTESTFSGWPGSQGIRVSFMSCLFVSSMQTTGRRGSYGR